MSVIVQQPDSLSFAGNLKKFVVTSAVAVALQLNKGAEQILNEIYQPSAGSIVEIDLRTVIDKVLSVTLPGTNLITEQSSGFADFTATIDGTAVAFRVIKGGVLELGSMASDFVNEHFLTWQIQDQQILQRQPEWLTVYTNAARNLKAKAYYQDNTNASMLLTALDADKLLAVDVSWASVNSLFVKKNPIAWEVWFEDLAGTRLSYVQRYCLRNSDDEEKIFIWANTMGGIDSISLTGSAEDDKKLEHLIAEMGDESLQEYQTDKKREIKQSTGFLTVDESRWIEDFFYSGRRYLVGEDGAVRSIVLASSKIVGSTADDLFDYEFNYRLASESQLLNLERSFDSLPALEVPVDFFLTELLSGLPVAQYSDGLLMAVQSPFAQAWQKLSMAQLWGSALPTLIDGITLSFVNGKLQVNGVSGGVGVSAWGDLTDKPFSTLSNLFTVSPEGVLTLANTYALIHTHPYLSDADARIVNWNSAFSWGNHATAGYAAAHTHPYRPDTWVPSWGEVSAKPVWTEKFGWDGTAVTIAGDLHVTGKIISDGSMQFFGISSGGSGGGGSTTLWGLSDVSDDVANAVYGDLIMYNGTHFARINQSVLAPAVHTHTIGQVNGLQGALDGKQASGSYLAYRTFGTAANSAKTDFTYNTGITDPAQNWDTIDWGPNQSSIAMMDGPANPPIANIYNWSLIQQGNTTRGSQLAIGAYGGNVMYFRGSNAESNTWRAWQKVWHDGNLNPSNYALVHTHPYLSDSDARIANWSTAFGWGNHAGLYRPLSYMPSWAEVTSKPTWTEKMGWDGAAVTIAGDLHVTGKIISDGSMQFFGISSGGSGGGGSTTLWGLSDVDDDVQNSVYGDLIMYNGTHWARINQSVLAPAVHTHTIGQVNGLQGALDGKQASGSYLAYRTFGTAANNATTDFTCNDIVPASNNWDTVEWGFYRSAIAKMDSVPNPPIANIYNWSLIQQGNATRGSQLAIGAYGGNVMYFRGSNVESNTWRAWQKVWHDGNLNPSNYALVHTHPYLSDSDARIANWSIAFGWGNHAGFGYGLASSLTAHAALTIAAHGLGASAFHADSYFLLNRTFGSAANNNSSDFLAYNGKAVDADKLDGLHSLDFGRFYDSKNASLTNGMNDVVSAFCAIEYDAYGATIPNSPSGYYGAMINVGAGSNRGFQLSSGYTISDDLYFRGKSDAGYGTWRRIWHSGNSNLSTVNWSANNITANGNIICLGTMEFYTASDRRLKMDFEAITNPIEKIKSLTGYFFNYTDQAMTLGGYTSRRDIGLIAQDVHAILPEATGKLWGTDYMGYKADKLIPLLVEAIKQQQTEIDQLKRQIAA